MKALALLAFLALPAHADIKTLHKSPDGGPISPSSITTSTLTVTGTASGGVCFSADSPTLTVDCSGDKVGIGTAAPLAKLHVAGDASVTGPATFGSSVTPSSVTVTGAFGVSGATFTVTTAGIVTAPSQPFIDAFDNAGQPLAASGESNIFFPVNQDEKGGGFIHLDTSSDTFTVPAGAGGRYAVFGQIDYGSSATAGAGRMCNIYVGASLKSQAVVQTVSSNSAIVQCGRIMTLAAGDNVFLKARADVAGLALSGSGSRLSIQKLW